MKVGKKEDSIWRDDLWLNLERFSLPPFENVKIWRTVDETRYEKGWVVFLCYIISFSISRGTCTTFSSYTMAAFCHLLRRAKQKIIYYFALMSGGVANQSRDVIYSDFLLGSVNEKYISPCNRLGDVLVTIPVFMLLHLISTPQNFAGLEEECNCEVYR